MPEKIYSQLGVVFQNIMQGPGSVPAHRPRAQQAGAEAAPAGEREHLGKAWTWKYKSELGELKITP